MKRTLILLAACAAALGMASCQVEVQAPEAAKTQITFTATTPGALTRTTHQDDGTTLWRPADCINVFYGSKSSAMFMSNNEEPAAVADFSGCLDVVVGSFGENASPNKFWAVFPYSRMNSCDGRSVTLSVPGEQHSGGIFAEGMFPCVACSDSYALPFYNVCGGIKFTLSRDDISKISVKSNAGEPLAGTVKVTFGEEGTPVVAVVSGLDEITLVRTVLANESTPDEKLILSTPANGYSRRYEIADSFVKDQYYYVSVLPGTLSKGITVTFTTTDDKEGVLNIQDEMVVNRSGFRTADNIDEYAEWGASDSYVEYGGVKYKTVTMKDGKTWMAENLRFLPEGVTPSEDKDDLSVGVWYPIDANKAFTKDETEIAKRGYLYSADVAFGLKPGTINAENFDQFEGCQGICPDDWHLPTGAEIFALCGRVSNWPGSPTATAPCDVDSPYYDGDASKLGNCTIAALNADGFNADKFGTITVAVSKDKVTRTNSNTMAYILSSTGYKWNPVAEGKVVEAYAQYYSIMISAANSNGALVNYKGGCIIRCVKD